MSENKLKIWILLNLLNVFGRLFGEDREGVGTGK